MTEEQKANYRKLDTTKYPLDYNVHGLQYEDYQYKLDEGILSEHGGMYQGTSPFYSLKEFARSTATLSRITDVAAKKAGKIF